MFGRRIYKSHRPGVGPVAPGDIERYVYDGESIIFQFDGNADLTHRYLQGQAVDQVLADEAMDISGSDILWPLADSQGSVRDLADYDEATDITTIANHIVYDAFGNISSETNAAVDSIFGYTGRETDPESDLYFYRARYYDPALGQFISEDPIGFDAGDANTRRYVGNDPINKVDPSGLEEIRIVRWGEIEELWTLNMISTAEYKNAQLKLSMSGRGAKVNVRILDPNRPMGPVEDISAGVAHFGNKVRLGLGSTLITASVLTKMHLERNSEDAQDLIKAHNIIISTDSQFSPRYHHPNEWLVWAERKFTTPNTDLHDTFQRMDPHVDYQKPEPNYHYHSFRPELRRKARAISPLGAALGEHNVVIVDLGIDGLISLAAPELFAFKGMTHVDDGFFIVNHLDGLPTKGGGIASKNMPQISPARRAAIRDALTDTNGRLLSSVERQGVKFTIRRVEALGFDLDGAIKIRGNQGIDLSFRGTGQNVGRFGLAEAKRSPGLGSLSRDTLGIRQGSFEFFSTRLQRAGRNDLRLQLEAGNVDLYGGFQRSERLFQFDPDIFIDDVNFRTTPKAATLIPLEIK